MCINREDIWHHVVQNLVVQTSSSRQTIDHAAEILKVISRLQALGFSSTEIANAKAKHKLRDVRTAVHYLRFTRHSEAIEAQAP